MTEIYRGDIYYIMPFYTVTGSEQRAGRPGVVVSNDINNRHSPNVEIVFDSVTSSTLTATLRATNDSRLSNDFRLSTITQTAQAGARLTCRHRWAVFLRGFFTDLWGFRPVPINALPQ